jgi:hypothetical protein
VAGRDVKIVANFCNDMFVSPAQIFFGVLVVLFGAVAVKFWRDVSINRWRVRELERLAFEIDATRPLVEDAPDPHYVGLRYRGWEFGSKGFYLYACLIPLRDRMAAASVTPVAARRALTMAGLASTLTVAAGLGLVLS